MSFFSSPGLITTSKLYFFWLATKVTTCLPGRREILSRGAIGVVLLVSLPSTKTLAHGLVLGTRKPSSPVVTTSCLAGSCLAGSCLAGSLGAWILVPEPLAR